MLTTSASLKLDVFACRVLSFIPSVYPQHKFVRIFAHCLTASFFDSLFCVVVRELGTFCILFGSPI